ncbi:SDR family oxidoreductase [Pusillimonas caeni]|uniref:SDR family NAD(P)-dependent oxidoreductase n=1 Tax=Pusillimonas caeni TaxID=1348472 RepID=UPI000E59F506|nr:SDR family NAD(P)-dependent oxidoreductase [Pusillimonas caeni]TFL13136.1 SDR family oxidoreductase [Pusillimonas caeni]
MNRLDGTVAIVTGAGGGIGRGIVRRYVSEGAKVVAADIDQKLLGRLDEEFGADIVTVQANVAQAQANRRLVETALAEFGRLDVFCANAGIYDQNVALADLDFEALDRGFDELFAVNVKSVLFAARAAYDALVESKGSLIVTASFASFSSSGGGALYTASKHAVVGLIKQLAYEFAPDIRVNGVAPGIAPTTLKGLNALGQQPKDSVLQGTERAVPLQAIPESDAYGGLYALLASRRDAGHITGSVFNADSGLAIRGMSKPGGRAR